MDPRLSLQKKIKNKKFSAHKPRAISFVLGFFVPTLNFLAKHPDLIKYQLSRISLSDPEIHLS